MTKGSLRKIKEEIAQAGYLETGGGLFGHERDNIFTVVDATGPGPDYDSSVTHFTPNINVLHRQIEEAEMRGQVYLGEWHRHPGDMTSPSQGDMETFANMLSRMQTIDSLLMGIATVRGRQMKFHAYAVQRDNISALGFYTIG